MQIRLEVTAESFEELEQIVRQMLDSPVATEPVAEPKPKAKKEPKAKAESKPKAKKEPKAEANGEWTEAKLKALLVQKAASNKAAVVEALNAVDAENLSSVDEQNYAKLGEALSAI